MNSYEEKQEARRARYEEKASRLRDEAHRLHDQAHEMASAIPFGQPILVGHHSEGRDRRYRDRIHNTFGKAFATMDKADYYEEKAAKDAAFQEQGLVVASGLLGGESIVGVILAFVSVGLSLLG